MTNRMTGVVSGLDTESLIKETMSAYQSKIDKKTQQKECYELQQSIYQDVIKDGKEFYNKYFDLTNSGNLLSKNTFSTVSFTSSNQSIASAVGNSDAVKDNYTVDVTQVAKATSQSFSFDDISGNIEFKTSTGSVIIKAEDLDKLTTEKEKANYLKKHLSSIGLTAYTSDFKSGINIETTKTGADTSFTMSTGSYVPESFTVNDTISVGAKTGDDIPSASMNLNDLLEYDASDPTKAKLKTDLQFKVGSNTYTVKASSIGTLDFSNLKAGETAESKLASAISGSLKGISVTTDQAKPGEIKFNVTENDTLVNDDYAFTIDKGTYNAPSIDSSTGSVNTYSNGQNAIMTVTGSRGSLTKESDSNTVVIDGVSITASGVGTTTLVGKNDSTALKDKIVDFVNSYNTFIEKLSTLINEKRDRDYQPLTSAQKEEMSDKEIEKWEKKVKTGQVSRDSDLTRIYNNLKSAMTSSVLGCGTNLESIGIKPVDNYSTKNGMLTIDENKLTKALEEDPESVMNMFTQKPENTDGLTSAQISSKTGIMYRMKDILNDEFVSSTKSALIHKAGYEGTVYVSQNTISRQIKALKEKISEMEDRYTDKENALYKKYGSLESMMNYYNTQQSYLSGMFSN